MVYCYERTLPMRQPVGLAMTKQRREASAPTVASEPEMFNQSRAGLTRKRPGVKILQIDGQGSQVLPQDEDRR